MSSTSGSSHPNNSQSTSTQSVNAGEVAKFKCPFPGCNKRPWFDGYTSETDLRFHMILHSCQWQTASGRRHCNYLPQSVEDARNHLEAHIDDNEMPNIKLAEHAKETYYCAWGTCTTHGYCVKGTQNKEQLLSHIRKHLIQSVLSGST